MWMQSVPQEGSTVDDPTTTSADTERGPIQYADSGGDGAPVLFVHGTPGGCDQGQLMGRFLASNGFRVIAPSRPGYLGTPLGDDRTTPAQQAGLHAALMEHLGIDRFALACWSGGGASGYQLAIDRPEMVRAVAALAAVSQPYTFEHPSEEKALFGRPGAWLLRELARHAPHTTVKMVVTEEGDLSTADARELVSAIWEDEATRRWVLDWSATVSGARAPGFDNDRRQLAELTLDLASLTTPVLLVHADTDSDVPYEHSRHAAAALPDAELVTVERGTHLSVWTGPDQQAVQARVIEALRAG